MRTFAFLSIVLVFACGAGKLPEPEVFVLNAHAMVYHSGEAEIYLFGGANEQEVVNELWRLEKLGWRKVKTDRSPEPRTFAAMVYDEKKERIVLFGGSKVLFGNEATSVNLLNDTWAFRDGQWTKIATTSPPPARAESAMSYDPLNERIVLFGGYTIREGEYVKLGDTWELVDDEWRKVPVSGPSPRHGVAMGYDPVNKGILLFGGSTVDGQYGAGSGESWVYKNQSWLRIDHLQPPGIFNAAMAYDGTKERFIRFGGWDGNARTNETWLFKHDVWEKIETPGGPGPRNHSSMVFNEKTGKAVLFGGHNGKEVFGDVWTFHNEKWTRVLDVAPKPRVENNH